MQLEVDADPMAPYMALPAVHIRSSPLSFSSILSTVYEVLVAYLTDFYHSVCLDTSCVLACLLRQSPFQ